MKKSEKLKGKEKVAVHKEQYRKAGIVIGIAVIIIACIAVYFVFLSPQVVVATGDTIGVTYTGMLDNGTVFDTNVNKSPLTFTVGGGQMIPGFDAAVVGMKANEEKRVWIPAAQAYTYNPALVWIASKSQMPANQTLYPGEVLGVRNSADGSAYYVRVVNITSAGVAVDANSPLTGQNLTFDIKVDSIRKASSGSTAAGTS